MSKKQKLERLESLLQMAENEIRDLKVLRNAALEKIYDVEETLRMMGDVFTEDE